jgi:hypothetical protein
LSELLDAIAREPVQIEVSAVRILFELLGFLLKTSGQLSAFSHTIRFIFRNNVNGLGWRLTALRRSVYNEGRTF